MSVLRRYGSRARALERQAERRGLGLGLGFVVECTLHVRDLTKQTEAFGDGAKRMKCVLLRNKGRADSVLPVT